MTISLTSADLQKVSQVIQAVYDFAQNKRFISGKVVVAIEASDPAVWELFSKKIAQALIFPGSSFKECTILKKTSAPLLALSRSSYTQPIPGLGTIGLSPVSQTLSSLT